MVIPVTFFASETAIFYPSERENPQCLPDGRLFFNKIAAALCARDSDNSAVKNNHIQVEQCHCGYKTTYVLKKGK